LLGWQIYILAKREGKHESVAVWKSGLGGSGWIRKLVENGQATDLGGNGYPDRYSAQAKYLFQEMLSHEPTDSNNKTMPAYDRTIIRHDLIEKLDPEEILEIEFWDQS
jgi:hypothetical protein